jgi:hypothetical protein
VSEKRLLCRIGWHGPLQADVRKRTDTCLSCGSASRLYVWKPKSRLARAFVRWFS